MERQVKNYSIKGIQRNLPQTVASEFSCQEIVNMREKYGAWKPTRKKTVISNDNPMMKNALGFKLRKMYIHNALSCKRMIGCVSKYYYQDGEVVRYVDVLHSDFPPVADTTAKSFFSFSIETIDGNIAFEPKIRLDSVGNFLSLYIDDGVSQYATHFVLKENSSGEFDYLVMPALPASVNAEFQIRDSKEQISNSTDKDIVKDELNKSGRYGLVSLIVANTIGDYVYPIMPPVLIQLGEGKIGDMPYGQRIHASNLLMRNIISSDEWKPLIDKSCVYATLPTSPSKAGTNSDYLANETFRQVQRITDEGSSHLNATEKINLKQSVWRDMFMSLTTHSVGFHRILETSGGGDITESMGDDNQYFKFHCNKQGGPGLTERDFLILKKKTEDRFYFEADVDFSLDDSKTGNNNWALCLYHSADLPDNLVNFNAREISMVGTITGGRLKQSIAFNMVESGYYFWGISLVAKDKPQNDLEIDNSDRTDIKITLSKESTDGGDITDILLKEEESFLTGQVMPALSANNNIYGKGSIVFNSRQFICNTTTNLFKGYSSYDYLGAYNQDANFTAFYVTYLKIDNSDYTVVAESAANIAHTLISSYVLLPSMLAYPDSRAYKIELYINNKVYGSKTHKIGSWDLTKLESINMAVKVLYAFGVTNAE